MKLTWTVASPPQKALQGPKKAPVRFKAGVFALSMLGTGLMLEGVPRAENPPQHVPQTQPAETQPSSRPASSNSSVPENMIRISDGRESLLVHPVSRRQGVVPSIPVKGPAKVYVRYYPIVRLKRFAKIDSVIPWTVKYTVTGDDGKSEGREYEGRTSISNFRTPAINHTRVAIGTGMPFTARVPKGMQTLAFPFTNGFVLIERTEATPEEGAVPTPVARPVQSKKTVKRRVPKPANATSENLPALPRFTFEAERESLHAMGSGAISGDMNLASAAVNIHLHRNLAMALGAHFSSFGMGIRQQDFRTSLRSYSADLTAGIILMLGRHRASATVLGGDRVMLRGISQDSGPHTGNETTNGYEIGGILGYSYGRAFKTKVSVSNDPFCPLSLKMKGEFPFGWVKGANIWAEMDALWLHVLQPLAEEGLMGGISLRENNVYARLMAGVPVWKVWRFLPSLLVAGTVNASEAGFQHADLVLGGELSLLLDRLHLKARGGVSVFGQSPLFQVGVSY
jgi:hypothetical protein